MTHSQRAALLAAIGSLIAVRCTAAPATDPGEDSSSRVTLARSDASQIRLQPTNAADQLFYAGHQTGRAWSADDAADLENALEEAGRNGIDSRPLLALINGSAGPAQRDARLTQAALAYASALSAGVSDPNTIFKIYTLRRNKIDIVTALGQALADHKVRQWLNSLPPQDAGYRALSRAYLDMVRQEDDPAPQRIVPGPAIRTGSLDARVPGVLAALEAQTGAPPHPAPGAATDGVDVESADQHPTEWTAARAGLLIAYQRDHGLKADGVLGPNTLAMLNATPADKARRLAVNLERLRWLQRNPPETRIDVNIAASTLSYVVDGLTVWTTPVAPGRAGHETPQLEASFSRLVVNPPWNVPGSIARAEIDPKGAAYLRRHHMLRVGGRIVQTPGPWAALGQIKFDLQDNYAIYLHDTPDKSVFDRSQRHLSHGCIRVDDAVAFGHRLAVESGQSAKFERSLASGKTGVVALKESVPVRLLYETAIVGDDGRVSFRPDVYGWDVRMAKRLGMIAPVQEGVEPPIAAPLGP